MEEVWVDIKGYEDLYQISNFHNVRSLKKDGSYLILKQYVLVRHNLPYKFVTLSKCGTRKTAYIHRLLAEAFIPNPENKREVDHIDGNSLNNSVSNLRWCTTKENASNPITVQRKRLNCGKKKQVGIVETTKDGEILHYFHSYREAERELGIWHTLIRRACIKENIEVQGHYFRLA